MKKILTLVLMAVFCLPAFAAKKVSDPVLKINENGGLIVSNHSNKYVYKYSISTSGTPSQPETVLPEEGLILTKSGTYNIVVTAETKKGKPVAHACACYHVYTLPGTVKGPITVQARGTDEVQFAPFSVTNTTDTDLTVSRGHQGKFWKFEKKSAGGDIQNGLEIGVYTKYPSRVSFYIKERTGDGIKSKKVYVYYDGISHGDTGYGIKVPAVTSKSIAGQYAPIWDLGSKGFAGKRVHFRMANASEAMSWSVLEQGFASFE